MQLLISAILTLVLGVGAFVGLNHNAKTLVANATETHENSIEASPTASPSASPMGTPIASVLPSPSASPTNNGLHLGIIRGLHLGEDKEEEKENEKAEINENEHLKPSTSPAPTGSPIRQIDLED